VTSRLGTGKPLTFFLQYMLILFKVRLSNEKTPKSLITSSLKLGRRKAYLDTKPATNFKINIVTYVRIHGLSNDTHSRANLILPVGPFKYIGQTIGYLVKNSVFFSDQE
jgi:hypothetical protein